MSVTTKQPAWKEADRLAALRAYDILDTPPDEIPAVPNAKYTFKLEPTGGTIADRDWHLEVTFQ